MAITIDAVITTETTVYTLRVTLTSLTPIADPVAYVAQTAVTAEILARAGLPSLLYLGSTLVDQGAIGIERYYTLTVDFDNTHTLATGHYHDSSTLSHPLREAYRDGPFIDLAATLGAVEIWSTVDTIDYFKVGKQGAAAPYFLVKGDGTIQWNSHSRWWTDNTHDVGSVDAGVTLRRPRDVYVGRNVLAGGAGSFGTYGRAPSWQVTPQAANPSVDPAVRHLYWNNTDNTLRGWDGSVEFILGGGTGTGLTGVYTCPPGMNVGDVACIVGSSLVAQAEVTLLGLKPVIGVCVGKPVATTAIIQLYGEVNIFAGGLTPNKLYYLGHVPGSITFDTTSFVLGETLQLIGISKTSSVLTLRYETRILV